MNSCFLIWECGVSRGPLFIAKWEANADVLFFSNSGIYPTFISCLFELRHQFWCWFIYLFITSLSHFPFFLHKKLISQQLTHVCHYSQAEMTCTKLYHGNHGSQHLFREIAKPSQMFWGSFFFFFFFTRYFFPDAFASIYSTREMTMSFDMCSRQPNRGGCHHV